MLTRALVDLVVSRITYRDWQFRITDLGDGWALQVEVTAAPAGAGGDESWRGRKWYLSPNATISEAIQTALKAVLTALEHEAREAFQYDGRAIYGPHLRYEALWGIAPETEHRSLRLGLRR